MGFCLATRLFFPFIKNNKAINSLMLSFEKKKINCGNSSQNKNENILS